jgi:DNA-binding transcriptional ArsR family regulator
VPPSRQIARAAPVFAALGDETRLFIVNRLSAGAPLSIAALTDGTDVTRQAVTKHLRVLEAAGLIRAKRKGRESLWQVRARSLEDARRALDVISRQWDEALGRLKALIEE